MAALTVTATLVSVMPGLAVPAPAGATLNETSLSVQVRGRVTTFDGVGIEDARVTAYAGDGADFPYADTGSTDADGDYVLEVLPGSYVLRFEGNGEQLGEWWSDAPRREDASRLVVGDDPVLDVDATLAPTSTVTGRVTDDSGTPLAGAIVVATRERTPGESSTRSARATTDVAGRYVLPSLQEGSYLVTASADHHAPRSWPDAAETAEATPLVLGRSETLEGIDLSLADGGTLRGVVRRAGSVVPHARLEVYRQRTSGAPDLVKEVGTDTDGRWVLDGLTAADYLVRLPERRDVEVQDPGRLQWVAQWWSGAHDASRARVARVVEDGEVVVDLAARAGASLTLDVLSAPGWEDAGLSLRLYRLGDQGWARAGDSPQRRGPGRLVATALEPGTYRVAVHADRGLESRTWWWDGATDLEGSRDVVVPEDGSVDLGPAALTQPATIMGTVTRPDGTPAPNQEVQAYQRGPGLAGRPGDWEVQATTQTDASGAFALRGLGGGTYRLRFLGTPHLEAWWGGAEKVESGADVEVAPGGARTGITARLSDGAVVRGTVSDSAGRGVPVRVTAYRVTSNGQWNPSREASADLETGRYEIKGLQADTYHLRFSGGAHPPRWVARWWGGSESDDPASGADLVVGAEQVVVGIDTRLRDAASIGGTVVGDHPGVTCPCHVYLSSQYPSGGWAEEDDVRTGPDGRYLFSAVRPGTYSVSFHAPGAASELWRDAPVAEERTPFVVAAGEELRAMDAVLSRAATVSGRVVDEAGRGVSTQVTAFLRRRSGWIERRVVDTDAAGRYALDGLTAGTYRIGFQGPGVREFFDDAPEIERATDLVLTAGEVVEGIDATVFEAPRVTGRVTDADGTPLGGAWVNVSPPGGGPGGGAVETGPDGRYEVAVSPGRYRVRVSPPDSRLGTGWWGGGTDETSAGRLLVLDGTLTEGVDVVVRPRGSVTGTVARGTGPVYAQRLVDGHWSTEIGYPSHRGADGSFRIDGLDAGTYRVRLGARLWWPAAADRASAEDIVVDGGLVSGIDARDTVGLPVVTATARPTIVGRPVVGRELGSTPPTWADGEPEVRYRWLADGALVAGATGPTFRPGTAELGKRLSLEVRGAREEWVSTTSRSLTTEPVDGDDAAVVAAVDGVDLRGRAAVGGTLRADVGRWVPNAVTFRYQWLRDGVAVPGATATAYRIGPADGGSRLSVRVVGYGPGLPSTTVTSAATPRLPLGSFVNVAPPTISGRPVAGERLRVDVGRWSPTPGTVEVAWSRDGEPVRGARGTSLLLTPDDVGHRIGVTVTVVAPGHAPTSRNAAITTAVTRGVLTSVRRPTVRGASRVGSRLVASAGAWTPRPETVVYRWTRDGRTIARATGSTYLLRSADRGHRIRVVVGVRRTGWRPGTATSTATSAVSGPRAR